MVRIVLFLLQACALAVLSAAAKPKLTRVSVEQWGAGKSAIRRLVEQLEAKSSSEPGATAAAAAAADADADVSSPRRFLAKRKHPPGKGKHCKLGQPCKSGHWRAAGSGNDNNGGGGNGGHSSGNSCPTPPSNFTEEYVQQIPIQSLVQSSPILDNPQFIGRQCTGLSGPSTFDTTTGSIDLCDWQTDIGVLRTSSKQKYGLYSADIKCPDNYLSGFATAFYLTNDLAQGTQDEIDIEFLNRLNTVMQVNIWVGGTSVNFENVWLPYNCAKDFHNYAILYTPQVIAVFVDYELKHYYPNTESLDGKKFPNADMAQVSSFWDGSGICGGCWSGKRQSWTYGPQFVASYRNVKKSKPILNALCASSFF